MLNSKYRCCLIILCVMVSNFTSKVGANCVCKEKGTDYCSSCSGQRIVRPQLQQYQKLDLNLPPIGDNCGCSKQLVEPVPLPNVPCFKHYKPTCSCKLMTNTVNKFPADISSYNEDSLSKSYNYVPLLQHQGYSIPADPLSVSLAIQTEKATQVPEAWTHGLVRKPVDQLERVVYSQVPEEKLFEIKNEVITLPKRIIGLSYKEEELDDYVEEIESEAVENIKIPQITYQQLGYRVEPINEPKFRAVYTEEEVLDNVNVTPRVQYGLAHNKDLPSKKCYRCSHKY